LIERFVCVPGIGDVETGLVSILDTSDFSVFWGGGFKESEKFYAGIRMKVGENKYGSGPHVL
jgi:hypothetical protein